MNRKLATFIVLAAFVGAWHPAQAQVPGNCGMQLGGTVTFCDTFATVNSGIPSRTGALDPNVWGVSRLTGFVNFGQGYFNGWAATEKILLCDGSTPTVAPPTDIQICNNQLREVTNDNPSGVFEGGNVTTLAMYPKQPFDFAGRTGTVSFDVSNDSHGTHAAWPEFWVSDLPVPAPFSHFDTWQTLPANGLGIRFGNAAPAGNQGLCPNANNVNMPRWTVDSALVSRGYVMEDANFQGTDYGVASNPPLTLNILDCVIAPADGSGILNHVEIQINQSEIDIYASDAGSTALRKIASLTNANLTFTRGLVWLEDVHYNADKGLAPSQANHTFVWDNLAFDGPFTYRDFSYDALDVGQVNATLNTMDLGKFSGAGQTASWNVLNVPTNPNPAAVRVLFNFNHITAPNATTLNVIVNGHAHSAPWPYPDQLQGTWRTFAVTIPVTDLVAGTNVVQLGSDQPMITSNVNIVLGNVPGGVPILPGSNNAYPGNVAPPPPPPVVTLTAKPTLTWSTTGATSCTSSGGWSGRRNLSGTQTEPITTSPTTYTLTCTGAGGTTTKSVTVTITSSITNPPPVAGCNLSAPAFCETFNEGPSVNNGRGGDLDPAKWTASRLSSEISAGNGALNPQLVAPIPSCRSTFTQTNVFSPHDTLICDPSGNKTAQLMTAVSIQPFGNNSYMILQPFDFAGRTGKIEFDVDAVSQPLGGYPQIAITDQPVPASTYREFNNFEVGPLPQNAIIVKFGNTCNDNTSAAPYNVMVYNNYVGTILTPTYSSANGGCVQTAVGSLNHFEIQLSQSQISVYGSDFSTDNVTFPNYKLLYQASMILPFSRAYVHVDARNHASIKYGYGEDAVFHWDNIGFDGPVLPMVRAYEIPDNTTTSTFTGYLGDPTPIPAINLGYLLLDGTTGPSAGMYDPNTLIPSLSFQNVNLSGATSATLTFNTWFNASDHTPDATWGISYQINGGSWATVNPTAAQIAAMSNNTGGFYQAFFTPVINVPIGNLVQGTNTIKFLPVNAPMDYPPVVTNIDLLVQ
jgi:hypothetical protein